MQKILVKKGLSTYVVISGLSYAGMQMKDSFTELQAFQKDPLLLKVRDDWRELNTISRGWGFVDFTPDDDEAILRPYKNRKEAVSAGLHKHAGENFVKSLLWPWKAFDFIKETGVLIADEISQILQ